MTGKVIPFARPVRPDPIKVQRDALLHEAFDLLAILGLIVSIGVVLAVVIVAICAVLVVIGVPSS